MSLIVLHLNKILRRSGCALIALLVWSYCALTDLIWGKVALILRSRRTQKFKNSRSTKQCNQSALFGHQERNISAFEHLFPHFSAIWALIDTNISATWAQRERDLSSKIALHIPFILPTTFVTKTMDNHLLSRTKKYYSDSVLK